MDILKGNFKVKKQPKVKISEENADSLEIFHCYLQRQLGFVS
mgnify:CR=1 FL=1